MTLGADRRSSVIYAGVLSAVMIAIIAAQLVAAEYTQFFIDVKIPYCAGLAMTHGLDPYRFGPMSPCEHALAAPFVPALRAFDAALPVPLAPYEMLPFVALAQLPFGAALIVWMALNIAGCAVAADLLRRMLPRVHPALIGGAIVISAVPVGLDLGQFTGIVLLAIVGLGIALRDVRRVALGIWIVIASLQPHVALPAVVALFFGGGRAARVAVAAAVLGIAAVSVVFLGPLTWEWVRVVLPGHGFVNLIDSGQVSFVSAAATLGAPLAPLGTISKLIYAIAIVLGAVTGTRIARRFGRPEALPWVGAAVGALGAPYLHLQQITFVLPAALLLVDLAPARRLQALAVYGLAIPWMALVMQSWGLGFGVVASGAAWRGPAPRRLLALAGTCVAICSLLIVLAIAFTKLRHGEAMLPPATLAPDAFTEDAWAPFAAIQAAALGLATLPARIVTWCAGLLLIALCVRTAFGPPPATLAPASVE